MNLSCGRCKAIQSFSGDPPKCDVCGWVSEPIDTPYWQNLRNERQKPVATTPEYHSDDTDYDHGYDPEYDREDGYGATNDDVVGAINEVQRAIEEKWTFVQWAFVVVCVFYLWSLAKDAWYSKWRLSAAYDVPTEKIVVDRTPHDCDFLASPIGKKYCSYKREVTVIRWATSTGGDPIVSYDDGQHWSVFTPDVGAVVPKTSTVQHVMVSWKKSDEDE